MAKLYPPNIEGTIPAFYKNDDGTATIAVPFSMNTAVNKSAVTGFQLKLKTVQNSTYLLSLSTNSVEDYELDTNCCVYFRLTKAQADKLYIGQYYKIQIAYINNYEVGYFSTVGVIKCTTKPIIEIANMTSSGINIHKYSYTGVYTQAIFEYKQVYVDGYIPIKLTIDTYIPNIYYILKDKSYILASDNYDDTIQYYKYVSYYQPNTYYIKSENGYKLDDSSRISIGQIYYSRTPIIDETNNNFKDSSEKANEYRFTVTYNNQIQFDSGWKLHNSSKDILPYESNDLYEFQSDLIENVTYYIQYSIRTNNGLELSSPKYRIMQKKSISPEIKTSIIAELNEDNGYINVSLIGEKDNEGNETAATGLFVVSRASSEDNYMIWHEINRFALHGEHPSRQIWKDFTIEQGKGYKYSLQQYSDSGLYSSRIISNLVRANFEDMFLYDGEVQLKIKYNPKVSSFKTNYLESKLETIGSKYPFIFRNGNVSYKEFPLSGLISYWSDEENLFIKNDEIELLNKYQKFKRYGTFLDEMKNYNYVSDYLEDLYKTMSTLPAEQYKLREKYQSYIEAISQNNVNIQRQLNLQREQEINLNNDRAKTTDLNDYNILAERLFKLKVLNWLNNGKEKLFRSPTEGNYIVRIMNVSLTPEDKVGRMLHTFNATAYEIADCSYDTLSKYGIIEVDEPNNIQLRYESVPISTTEDKSDDSRYIIPENGKQLYTLRDINILQSHAAITVRFTDMIPGAIIYFTQENGPEQEVMIGATGTYMLDTGFKITNIHLDPNKSKGQGMITYSYEDNAQNIFNEIEMIDIIDIPARQFFNHNKNILDIINNIRDEVLLFFYLNFQIRTIYPAYGIQNKDDGHFEVYRDMELTRPIINLDPDQWVVKKLQQGYKIEDLIPQIYESIDNNKILGQDEIINSDNAKAFGDRFEDTFALYYFELNTWKLQFITSQNQLIEKVINSNTPLGFYYDLKNIDAIIVTPETDDIIRKQIGNELVDSLSNYYVYSTSIYFNNGKDEETIDLKDIEYLMLKNDLLFDSIVFGAGVYLNCGYQIQRIHYSLEYTNKETKLALSTLNKLINTFSIDASQVTDEKALYTIIKNAIVARYNYLYDSSYIDNFLNALTKAKEEWEATLT